MKNYTQFPPHMFKGTPQQNVICVQEPNSLAGFTGGFLVHAANLGRTAELTASSFGITYTGGERKQGCVRMKTRQE